VTIKITAVLTTLFRLHPFLQL